MGPDTGGEVPGPRDVLVAERARTQELLAHLRADFDGVVDASRDTNADDEHDPEGQTIAYERSRTDALLRQAERHLTEVASALARVDDGSYGVCETCRRPIARGRLEARPTARTCVACVPPRRGSR